MIFSIQVCPKSMFNGPRSNHNPWNALAHAEFAVGSSVDFASLGVSPWRLLDWDFFRLFAVSKISQAKGPIRVVDL